MSATTDFDIISYLENVTAENKICINNNFKFCTCSGVQALEGVLENYRNSPAFVCVDDSDDSNVFTHGSGWFRRRSVTIFFLARCSFKDAEDRIYWNDLCRELYRQFLSRLINDRHKFETSLVYFRLDNIYSRNITIQEPADMTGLYMMFNVDEPYNLCYNSSQWQQ